MQAVNRCLIVIVSAALVVSQTIAELHDDKILIDYPKQSKGELSREQLLDELDKITYDYNRQILNDIEVPPLQTETIVASLLDRVKDKATTEVYNGLTVAKLIEQNSFNGLKECSPGALKKRVKVLSEAESKHIMPKGRIFAINLYAYQCLHLAVKLCLKNKAKVIEEAINEQQWLDGLQECGMWNDSEIEHKIHFGTIRSNLPHYIAKGPHRDEVDEDNRLVEQVSNDGTLIAHPLAPSAELTRDELVAELNKIKQDSYFRIEELVLENLYKTKSKKSTIIVNGVSVAKLIEMNSMPNLAECSQRELKTRARALAEADSSGSAEGITLAINVYAFKCLHKAAKYCLMEKDKVIEQRINEQNWLDGLRDNMWADKQIDNNIYLGHTRSNLPHYIANGPEPSGLQEKDRRIEVQINSGATLLPHPAPSDELTRDELMNRLGRLHRTSYYPIAEFVLENLYKTMDKDSTAVINGITVEKLIGHNNYNSMNDCSRDALKERSELYFETRPMVGTRNEIAHAINFYVTKCLYYLARYCYDNRDKLVRQGINKDASWLDQLGLKQSDSLRKVQEDIYFTDYLPRLPAFMFGETESRRRLLEK